jgi:hypothetical protein
MRLSHIQYHLTEHCNLNCKACSHFSSIAKPEFKDIEQNKKDLTRLSQLFDGIDRIIIMGGEPLLHEKVLEFAINARNLFPCSNITIFTNGILLPKMDKNFWETLNKNSIEIEMTVYPLFHKIKDEMIEVARKYGIRLLTVPKKSFAKFLVLDGSLDKQEMFNKCDGKICHNIRNGMIATCYMPFFIDHFNKKFNENLPNNDVLNIYDENITTQKIIDFLNTPNEICKYCLWPPIWFPWDKSYNPEKLDWIVKE